MKRFLCVLGLVAVLGGCGKSELDKLTERAEQGDTEAQYHLGEMFNFGKGVAQDDKEAVKWLRKAAEGGHLDAQLALGLAYEKGLEVAEDKAEAVKWYRKAAEQGDINAKYSLERLGIE